MRDHAWPCQPKVTWPLAACGQFSSLSFSPRSVTSLTYSESGFFRLPSVSLGGDWLVEIQPAPQVLGLSSQHFHCESVYMAMNGFTYGKAREENQDFLTSIIHE